MENLKKYETVSAFTETEGNDLRITSVVPGAGYIEETNESKYNNDLQVLIIVYKVTDGSSATKLYKSDHVKDDLKDVIIDGQIYPKSALTQMWNFSKGLHQVEYRYTVKTSLWGDFFGGCSSITYVNIPKTVSQLGDALFDDCVNLRTVILNYDGVISMRGASSQYQAWAYPFRGCSRITTFKVPEAYLADYRKLSGVQYGANAVVPIGKRIVNTDFGTLTIKKWTHNGSISDYTWYSDGGINMVVPAITDYIEIPETTTAITLNSGNLNYYPPYKGAYANVHTLLYDENREVISTVQNTFQKATEEKRIEIPQGCKYIRYTILARRPNGAWPRYAHVMDADTTEIIYPRITWGDLH